MGELESDVFVQSVDQLLLRAGEPSPLQLENLGHILITQFSDEGSQGKLLQSFAVGNCRFETIRITVGLHQRMAVDGVSRMRTKSRGGGMKQPVFLNPAVFIKSDAGVPNKLICRKSCGAIVVGRLGRQGRTVFHLDEDRRCRVLPSDHDIHLSLSFVPLQMMPGICSLLLPEFDLQIPKHLAAESLGTQGPVQKVRQPPPGIEDFQDAEEFSRDDSSLVGANDQRASQFSLACRLTQTTSLTVHFGEHVKPDSIYGAPCSGNCGLSVATATVWIFGSDRPMLFFITPHSC